MQDTRIALLGIILTSHDSVEKLNHLLSQYSSYIIGRMGVPYREKNISIISVALDAPNDIIQMISLVLFPEKSECCPASVVKQSTPKVNHYHFIWRN